MRGKNRGIVFQSDGYDQDINCGTGNPCPAEGARTYSSKSRVPFAQDVFRDVVNDHIGLEPDASRSCEGSHSLADSSEWSRGE
jgi:hypothetical protein